MLVTAAYLQFWCVHSLVKEDAQRFNVQESCIVFTLPQIVGDVVY